MCAIRRAACTRSSAEASRTWRPDQQGGEARRRRSAPTRRRTGRPAREDRGRRGSERRLLGALGHALGDCGARPLQRAVDRGDGRLAASSADSLAVKPSTSRSSSDRTLVGSQVLKRRNERKLHALALLIAGLRRRASGGKPDRLVRVGLEPRRLGGGHAGRGARRRRRGRSRAGGRAGDGARARSGRRWSRSSTATTGRRRRRAGRPRHATRAAASPEARRRRRAPSRACDSSARGARLGALDEIREVAISLGRGRAQRLLHDHQAVAGRVAEPEHRRHGVAHARDLGVNVDAAATSTRRGSRRRRRCSA